MAYGCSGVEEVNNSVVLGVGDDLEGGEEPQLSMSRTLEAIKHADVIKSLHASLREEVSSGLILSLEYRDFLIIVSVCCHVGRDPSELWQELLCDSARLKEYSIAMQSLATQHWVASASLGIGEGGHGCSRIFWCLEVCEHYYGEGHAMHRHLLKDLRRKGHGMPTLVALALLPKTEEMVSEVVSNMAAGSRSLLDVGSCFNPFSSFKGFEVTAIDIAPAHQVC